MGFENLDSTTDVFLVEDATNCRFQSVSFTGPLGTADLDTDGADTAGVRFGSTPSLISSQVVFDGCEFSGTTYGINTDQQVQAITVTNSKFDTLYKGVVLGDGTPINGGPTGFKITQNVFDNIYAEGIVFGDIQLNASGYNIFYDVANHFDGTLNPATYVIDIQQDNNVSIGDMFERADAYATTWPRVYINGTTSIAMTNSRQLALGSYVRETGDQFTLINNTSSAATIFTVDTADVGAFCINYTIVRDTGRRTGSIMVANQLSGGTPVYTDDYVENSSTGITLSLTETSTTTSFRYTSTNTGIDGTLTYSVTRLV
jgi:hypothetical protein